MEHMDSIIEFIKAKRPQRAIVVGAGFIGLEMTENFHEIGLKVDIVEMASQVLTQLDEEMAALVHARLRKAGVGLHLGRTVKGFRKAARRPGSRTGRRERPPGGHGHYGRWSSAGHRLAEECGLLVGSAGILVNDYLQTSDPAIYALGDAVEVRDSGSSTEHPYPSRAPPTSRGGLWPTTFCGRGAVPLQRWDGHRTSIWPVWGVALGLLAVPLRKAISTFPR